MTVTLKIPVFWDDTLLCGRQIPMFWRNSLFSKDGGGRFLYSDNTYLPNYMASHPVRQ